MILDDTESMGRTVLITGVAGMIGSHLADTMLDLGYRVIGVDNLSFGRIENLKQALLAYKSDRFRFIETDVCHSLSNVCNGEKVDFIYHLASLKKAPSGTVNLSDVMRTNSRMIHSVADFAARTNATLVFTSTSDVYSNSDNFREDEPVSIGPTNIPRYSYAMSKLHDEQLLLNMYHEGKINCVVFRVFGCFSERSSKDWSGGHIPIFIDRAMKNEPIIIHGDGSQTRSMCYVDDIVSGLMRPVWMDTGPLNGEIINIGSSEEMSVLDAAKMIIEITGSKSEIQFVPAKQVHGEYPEIRRRFANTEKFKRFTDGWLPPLVSFPNIREAFEHVVKEWQSKR